MFDRFSGHYGSLWGYFGLTLGSFMCQIWYIRVTLEPYVSHFDVEMPKMAHVMAICGGLMGPKSENVEKPLVFVCFLEGQSGHGYCRE